MAEPGGSACCCPTLKAGCPAGRRCPRREELDRLLKQILTGEMAAAFKGRTLNSTAAVKAPFRLDRPSGNARRGQFAEEHFPRVMHTRLLF